MSDVLPLTAVTLPPGGGGGEEEEEERKEGRKEIHVGGEERLGYS